ncbi:MAG: hypothetical protein A2487_00715 [Candidatus Raymondbacteria bacterium RifOxyC12_full_50_8]|uniref:STAS domain-containing protein n=1 Tax=Candidatus Raymondbacteria bacterium RIFOXYD12_FULL_49_13 TaxID=1817890 RepID=A0A1F7F9M5_UNCRA|nr:MAG: hypothetical protein A2350_03370 [Candidatus Raymondbacteria bacterium RifOxyB12_full_50_8]OGJ93250.1 MAG: hypothetical protein A2248_17935 [Candidatus Raymondbacteria bacterium RIFOXYA2_FULL_49_16]OGJ98156.1 MAG: hypothetical protein A2487_00715 [Candidatus Raymondbacteria bacterium RifOxyC12_full_50_8]OGK03333.1 MAG: hypothetical protein A2519_15280 [Candidatus Raymondbacteria bacterium RIFOXYD12_FULL_49_13]OGP44972.1 MAG: hypothetical protein A2324_19860 [Candidatus Raymondbacteria b
MADSPFVLKPEERGTYYLLTISGPFTAHHVLAVRKAFEAALAIGHTKMAFNLSGVDFLDSVGLGLLVNMKRKLDAAAGMFGIINPSQVVIDILDVSSTDQYLTVYRDVKNPDTVFD